MSSPSLEERVLIRVESAQDAARIVELLGSLGIEGAPCAKYSELCNEIERGAAAIILSEPSMVSYFDSRLPSILASQPTWSAIPTIIIPAESTATDSLSNELPLGATFIERPVRIKTLASIIRIALHARRNQYAMRDLLHQRETFVDLLRHEAAMKNEFLATLAHELRNPLAPIRTGLQILRLLPPGKPSLDTIEMMDRQVRHLVRLIDDLLDISRITRGKLELRKQRVALKVLLSNALESSKPFIDAGHHTLTMSAPDETIWLDVDPIRLSQVISNLLNNAAKYTPQGGAIALTARHKHNTIQIEVKDNGIGLSPQMLTKVFDMFSQVEPSTARSQGGLGIGLTLARRLAEMHEGAVEASSEGEGKGCTFTIILPFNKEIQGDPMQKPVEESADLAFHGKSHRVLVVDDQVDIAQSLKDLLSLLGQDTHTVHNGPEALQAARDFKPELIFLDIGLPGMSGYEVVRYLRAQEEALKPTIIAVTGWGDEHSITLAREAGFDKHLTKPVDPREIERILQTL
jgi:signal transduction histidine kinase